MIRAALVLIALAAGAVFALSREIQPAFACTGPGPIENLVHAEAIFEGRITALEPTTGEDPSWQRDPYEMTFEVVRGHLGVDEGQSVTALAFIPGQFPVMCPQFDRDPAALLGKYVVIGLFAPNAGDTRLVADAWAVPYMADAPGGELYDDAVRLAEMIADSNPAAPRLTIEPATATCGEPIRFRGERLPPGTYVVTSAARAYAMVTVTDSGTFDAKSVYQEHLCRLASENGRPLGFHVKRLPLQGHYDLDATVDITRATLAGAVDSWPPWPEIFVASGTVTCGGSVDVRGERFDPGEELALWVRGATATVPATVAGDGTFRASVPVPPVACTVLDPLLNAAQAGFPREIQELYPRANVFLRDLAGPTVPGPPDAGTGLSFLAEDRGVPWNDLVMVTILLLAFTGGTIAIINSTRRR